MYHCNNEIDGVYGGIDETFESFKCTDEGLYDVPNPSKTKLAKGEHGWPLCLSQEGRKFVLFIVYSLSSILFYESEFTYIVYIYI